MDGVSRKEAFEAEVPAGGLSEDLVPGVPEGGGQRGEWLLSGAQENQDEGV